MSPLEALAGKHDGPSDASSAPIVTITDAALAKLVELRADEADADQLGLRLAVVSGPGEDFRYDLSFDEFLKAAFTDEVRTVTGTDGPAAGQSLKVIVPADSSELLRDATLDYTDSQGLVIRNPNKPAMPSVEGLVRGDELSAKIEVLVDTEVNPSLAAHGGFVTYMGHDGEGTVYMTMGGGCHGCSMSKVTMLEGVQTMLGEALPEVQRVRDLTDHASGENPYYS
ncbi:MAG TPA: NifU family protein [Ilumatobacter sp.]|nr:NifU family protein [Ilumatobacter sp.]